MAIPGSLTVSDVPQEHKAEIPRPSAQLQQLNRLNGLKQLHQVTDLAAPAMGLLGAFGSVSAQCVKGRPVSDGP